MISMSNVWDRATDVLRGRTGPMAGIAVLTLYLPALLSNAVTLLLAPGSTGFAAVGGLVAIVVAVVGIWGQLALLAIAIDPATTRADALREASARLPAALGLTVVAVLAALLLFVPVGVAIGASGADLSAMTSTGAMPDLGGGTVAFVGVYGLALLVVGLFVLARLVLLNATVLKERRGVGAFRRSFALTRGLTWRIIGVIVLYLIVLGVAVSAAQFIAGAIFGLLLDNGPLVALLTAAVAGVVTTIFSVIAAAFTAQLYVAVTQRGVATVFE